MTETELPIGEATRLLQAVREGDDRAESQLAEILYRELHGLANRIGPGAGHTLQPTALVNEVWLRLHGKLGDFADRRHFLSVACKAMRRLLANHARRARALKRDPGGERMTLSAFPGEENRELDVVALEDSLTKLATLNARHARVVELRFLCSLSIRETAEVLGVSHTTVENDWAMAQAWLRCELRLA